MDSKKCSKCGLIKELRYFDKRSNRPSGTTSACKICNRLLYKQSGKEWYEYKRQLRIRSPEKYILSRIKKSAKDRGLDFDLSEEDIVIPQFCPILGTKLDLSCRGHCENAVSVDRIDNSKGYIKGNIEVISNKANLMKNNATNEELIAFSKYFLNKLTC